MLEILKRMICLLVLLQWVVVSGTLISYPALSVVGAVEADKLAASQYPGEKEGRSTSDTDTQTGGGIISSCSTCSGQVVPGDLGVSWLLTSFDAWQRMVSGMTRASTFFVLPSEVLRSGRLAGAVAGQQ